METIEKRFHDCFYPPEQGTYRYTGQLAHKWACKAVTGPINDKGNWAAKKKPTDSFSWIDLHPSSLHLQCYCLYWLYRKTHRRVYNWQRVVNHVRSSSIIWLDHCTPQLDSYPDAPVQSIFQPLCIHLPRFAPANWSSQANAFILPSRSPRELLIVSFNLGNTFSGNISTKVAGLPPEQFPFRSVIIRYTSPVVKINRWVSFITEHKKALPSLFSLCPTQLSFMMYNQLCRMNRKHLNPVTMGTWVHKKWRNSSFLQNRKFTVWLQKSFYQVRAWP